jgi:general secretion pathway protein D
VLVEALIMEVDVTDSEDLGINAMLALDRGWDTAIETATDPATAGALGTAGPIGAAQPFVANLFRRTPDGDTTIQAIIRASATDGDTNIVAMPHILTSDNEEAEIRVGDNIPIITSRVE